MGFQLRLHCRFLLLLCSLAAADIKARLFLLPFSSHSRCRGFEVLSSNLAWVPFFASLSLCFLTLRLSEIIRMRGREFLKEKRTCLRALTTVNAYQLSYLWGMRPTSVSHVTRMWQDTLPCRKKWWNADETIDFENDNTDPRIRSSRLFRTKLSNFP